MGFGRAKLALAAVALSLWLAGPAAGGVYGDFNNDGFADLAVGVPFESVDGVGAGAVNVLYGSARGLNATGDQFWHQNSPGVPDAGESGDRFGAALAVGDFDGDGYADLAIGAPSEDVGAVSDAGAVTVLYGSLLGLVDDGAQLWHQGVADVAADGAEAFDNFGMHLAAANFGKGSAADLAVGVPSEDVGTLMNAGAVDVLYGSASGITGDGDQFWHQDSPGVLDVSEEFDYWGSALAAADFGKTSHADLAIGAFAQNVGATLDAGAVNVVYGSTTGLTANGDQFWHRARTGVAGDGATQADAFGFTLAAADFGKSREADLAVGVPEEDAGANQAGAVNVLYGSSRGLTVVGDQIWHQNSPGVASTAAPDEFWGRVLAAGNVGRSSMADLAIGAPNEDLSSMFNAGAVNVLYGSASGLTAAADQFWHQSVPGVAGDGAEGSDNFGSSLAAANFGKGSTGDLAVGVRETVEAVSAAGAVHVFYGSATGLTVSADQFWHQSVPGASGDGNESGDGFGSSLAPRR